MHDITPDTNAFPDTTNAQSDHLLPEAVIENIKTYFGQAGLAWAHNFPNQLKQVANAWGLTVHAPFPNLSINFVAPVTLKTGGAAVLKMGFPHADFATECHALRHFNGQGAVELLRGKPEAGQMLLASIQPGTPLSQVPDDDQATRIAATTMAQLWRPADDPTLYPTIQDWFNALAQLRQRFNGSTGPFDPKLFDSAEKISTELLSDTGAPVLLHGDCHHDNIISGENDRWVAIDPKGVIGEREYEVGALLRNPNPSRCTHHFQRRIEILAETLGFDKQRITRWAFAQAVLACVWSVDGPADQWAPWMILAQHIRQLLD